LCEWITEGNNFCPFRSLPIHELPIRDNALELARADAIEHGLVIKSAAQNSDMVVGRDEDYVWPEVELAEIKFLYCGFYASWWGEKSGDISMYEVCRACRDGPSPKSELHLNHIECEKVGDLTNFINVVSH
jgi:hypothetical protein